MSFLAENFGISLNRKSDKYLGWLRMSQVNALINGFTRLKEKEAEAINRHSGQGTGRHDVSSIGELSKVPGVVVKNKKK